ncbi:hypothetical protein [Lysobacter sp. N42]|uniref:hypothetical protein n=1 Tax=Lysobacter sp. N42 TaxID=2545719 RepID=UPI00140547F3|nr:hypothetical protein [Lysobacter sp. N42]
MDNKVTKEHQEASIPKAQWQTPKVDSLKTEATEGKLFNFGIETSPSWGPS